MDVYASDEDDNSETLPLPLNVTEQLDGTLLKHRIEVFSRIDVSALLPNIKAPILQLHGLRDRIVSGNDAQLIQSSLPNVDRIDIEAPHLLLQTRPQQSSQLIVNHVYPGN